MKDRSWGHGWRTCRDGCKCKSFWDRVGGLQMEPNPAQEPNLAQFHPSAAAPALNWKNAGTAKWNAAKWGERWPRVWQPRQ